MAAVLRPLAHLTVFFGELTGRRSEGTEKKEEMTG
jgi:hypothetical protein